MQAELFQKLVHQIKQLHIWTTIKALQSKKRLSNLRKTIKKEVEESTEWFPTNPENTENLTTSFTVTSQGVTAVVTIRLA